MNQSRCLSHQRVLKILRIEINHNRVSRRLKLLFLVSRKVILENHGSQLLWKSPITRKNKPFHLSRKNKRADHESQKYPLPLSTVIAGLN